MVDAFLTLTPSSSFNNKIKRETIIHLCRHLQRQGLYLRTRDLIEGEDGLKKDREPEYV